MPMHVRSWRLIIGFVVALDGLMAFSPGLLAAPVHDFNKALGDAMRHYRWAGYYLHTGNIALAQFELDAFAAKSRALSERYAQSPPDIFAEDPKWRADIEALPATAKAALAFSEQGDIDKTRALLAPIRARVSELRRRNGLFLFADYIDAANGAFERLWRLRKNPPDFADPAQVAELYQDLSLTLYWYRRCYETASPAVRNNPQFQRLVNGSLESLGKIWQAARNRNSARIIGILREVRSADRLLYLQFD